MNHSPLLLIGASTRAAAWSAVRAGFSPTCIDLFADADLQRHAVAIRSDNYPHDLVALSRKTHGSAWLYTGALENYPDIVGVMAKERPLWGNDSQVLRSVRDPWNVSNALTSAGLHCPDLSREPSQDARRWLVKPLRSAGGTGIARWNGQVVGAEHYGQEWIDGEACSALYLGGLAGSGTLLGATWQLVGEAWLHAQPFHYCGSIGPMTPSEHPRATQTLARLGTILTTRFQLRGIFGVDFILRGEEVWPVEINPRYTASAEVLERSSGASFVGALAESFALKDATSLAVHAPAGPENETWGKAILFARDDLVFPGDGPWKSSVESSWVDAPLSAYADVPTAGAGIRKGQPILTLFASAKTRAGCLTNLQERARELEGLLCK